MNVEDTTVKIPAYRIHIKKLQIYLHPQQVKKIFF